MNLPKLAVKRPLAVTVIIFIILIIGLVSLWQTPLDLLPDIQPPVLAILTAFPGSSPQETLDLVTDPVEEAASTTSKLNTLTSSSGEHHSLVILQFDWGAEVKESREDLNARLDLLSLPGEVEPPRIIQFDPSMMPVMRVSVSGDDRKELTRWLEDEVSPRLKRVSGVAGVQVQGGTDTRLQVNLNPELMQEYRLAYDQIHDLLRSSFQNVPGGTLHLEETTTGVRLLGKYNRQKDLEDIKIGFITDERVIEEQLGQTLKTDINHLLSTEELAPEAPEIPLQKVLLQDMVQHTYKNPLERSIYLELDRESLHNHGLSAGELKEKLQSRFQMEISLLEDLLVIKKIPPEMKKEDIMNTKVVKTPNMDKWYRKVRQEIEDTMGEASRVAEEALAGLAFQLVSASSDPETHLAALPEGEAPFTPVTLGEVASIDIAEAPASTINRINGNPGVSLEIQKEGDANTVYTVRRVRETLQDLREDASREDASGVSSQPTFHAVFDQAREINAALSDLAITLSGGTLLAVMALLLFLRNARSTLFIALSIPAAVICTFSLLYFSELSVNLMTLGGMALAAGMLVDNAIVVSENIYRHFQKGSSPENAAIQGACEVSGAITASTLTSISVFFPVVFLSGLAGELFWEFALTVSCALIASLLIALTFIPVMASRQLSHPSSLVRPLPRFPLYRSLLNRSLKKPWLTLGAALVFLVAGGLIFPHLGTDLFPAPEENSFSIDITLPPGTPLETTDTYVSQLENILERRDEIASYSTRVGASEFFGLKFDRGNTNQARIRVYVDSGYPGKVEKIKDRVREQVEAMETEKEASTYFTRETLLDATGLEMNLEMVVEGDDLEKVKDISSRAAEKLNVHHKFNDVRSSLEESRPEIQLKLDHYSALQKGVSLSGIASLLREFMDERPLEEVETKKGPQEVFLGYCTSDLDTVEDLKELSFYPGNGEPVNLGEIAELKKDYGPLSIPREDRKVVGEIEAQFRGHDLQTVTETAMKELSGMELPPGYEIRPAGTSELMEEAFSELETVLLVASLLVYLVMAAQFESLRHPFIIICSLPLAFAGAILALFITGNSLSVPAMIGIIVLAGVLVNDSIIMVDYINQQRRISGLPLKEAVVEGALARIRPVLMTTVTTVLGLVPLAAGMGEGSQLQSPMGIAIIGGQLTGTALLLVVIPCVYLLVNRKN